VGRHVPPPHMSTALPPKPSRKGVFTLVGEGGGVIVVLADDDKG
jgi:hypothetical protein